MSHLTPETAYLIRRSWADVVPIAETAAGLFYQRLFTLDPSLSGHFADTDMNAQHTKLVAAISAVVDAADDLQSVIPTLQALGARHAGYGVTSAHYDTVGSALLWTLEQGLGPAFTAEVRAAWTVAYALIAAVMHQAGKDAVANAA